MRGFRTVVALACLGLLALLPASAGADEIEWMYDPDAVVEIHLGGLSEAELDELEAAPSDEVHGTFELTADGVPKGPVLNDVGIRLKGGAGSESPVKTGKSGFKVRFDKYGGPLFYGIRRLTLNNMIQDPSMVHESLTYELFHELGLPASRTGYAFVTLNGADYGLFLNLETLDEISLPQWYGSEDNTQHLYEADAPGTDVTPGDEFEIDEGGDDISDLEALVAAVNDEEGDWSENVSPFADLEQMTAHWAVERYVGHWDGYAGLPNEIDPDTRPNNYYLHSDAVGVFQMMPWGTDQTWERDDIPFDYPSGAVMFNECLADESCKQLYLEGLTDVYCVAPGLDFGSQAAQLAAMLAPYQDREDPVKRESTEEEIADGVEFVEGLAALRPEQLEEYLTEEGVLGNGEPHPCPPEPIIPGEEGLKPSTGSGTPPPATKADIGKLRRKGAVVLTNLHVTGSAKATQHVFTRIEGERRNLCSGEAERVGAGRLIVRCHLPEWALHRLADGPLKLKARIGFFPEVGTSRTASRRLTVPRR